MKCCFWCLENFIKFINKNAYIMIAIYGKGFCASARDGFSLILRNCVRYVFCSCIFCPFIMTNESSSSRAVVLDKVTDFLLLIGKLTITSAVAVVSFYVFSGRSSKFLNLDLPDLNYYWVPIFVSL